MARKDDEFYRTSKQEDSNPSRQLVQCPACSGIVGLSKTHPICPLCGAKLELSTPNYSGQSDDIVTGQDRFPVHRRGSTVERRRCNRVPCRGARACVRTHNSTTISGYMPNISRNGMCFRTVEQFPPEALISIATYYTEGGQNIFRDGRVIWTRAVDSGASEYGIEFADARYT